MDKEVQRIRKALKDLVELITDIQAGYFIPKRFRSEPFTDEKRAIYLTYLKSEQARLERRLPA
jgi:hypothetical protein